jgi:hypothetical protein
LCSLKPVTQINTLVKMDNVDFKLKLDDSDEKKEKAEKSEKSNELQYNTGGELMCQNAVLLYDWKQSRSSLGQQLLIASDFVINKLVLFCYCIVLCTDK